MGDQLERDPRYRRNREILGELTLGGFRVREGVEVPRLEFLHCVAVGCDAYWGCSGTLIGPNVVLTAGHCAGCATKICIGHDVNDEDDRKVVNVKERYAHADFQPDPDLSNDLMILVLEKSISDVACKIASKASIDMATTGRAVGFGTIDGAGYLGYGVKRYVDLPIASNDCQGSVDNVADSEYYGCHLGLELVAGRVGLEKDTCKGDSGGPFYILEDGRWLLAGATSRATKRAKETCGDGGIYVRVDHYRPWIEGIPGVELA